MLKTYGRVLFASAIGLAFASPAFAEAPIGAGFKTARDVKAAYKQCRKDARNTHKKWKDRRGAYRECRKIRKNMIKAHYAELKKSRKAFRQLRKDVTARWRAWRKSYRSRSCKRDKACRKAKWAALGEARKSVRAWRKAAKKWRKKLRRWARRGGDAPGWTAPAAPELKPLPMAAPEPK